VSQQFPQHIHYILISYSVSTVSTTYPLHPDILHVNSVLRVFIFSSPKGPDPLCSPYAFLFNGYCNSFPMLKWPDRKATPLSLLNNFITRTSTASLSVPISVFIDLYFCLFLRLCFLVFTVASLVSLYAPSTVRRS
jgi:hypothetical protein